MKKDIITVLLDNGTKKDMELILLYSDEDTNQNYVLYRELDAKEECYAAKYILNNNEFVLDTNLSKKEIAKLQLLLDTTLER